MHLDARVQLKVFAIGQRRGALSQTVLGHPGPIDFARVVGLVGGSSGVGGVISWLGSYIDARCVWNELPACRQWCPAANCNYSVGICSRRFYSIQDYSSAILSLLPGLEVRSVWPDNVAG